MKIITYATHSEGMFEELTSTGLVKVLGFGKKWNGFMDKFIGVLEYIETRPDYELVVFVDGFDSKINKNLDNLEEVFNSLHCKILISHENKNGISNYLPNFIHSYIIKKVFGTCERGQTANTGLYMGRVKELKLVLKTLLNEKSDDDQRSFNSVCSKFPFIRVDTDNVIFENCSHYNDPSNAYFVQLPATITFNRIIRSMSEYSKYFVLELFVLVLVLVLFIFFLYNQLKRSEFS